MDYGVMKRREIFKIYRDEGVVTYCELNGVKNGILAKMKTISIKAFLKWATRDITSKDKLPMLKRRRLPYKNKFGKNVKLNKQNPQMSPHEYGEYARTCLAQMDEDYRSFSFTISDIPNEDLLHYWVFLTVNQSNKSYFGKRSDFVKELHNRGYKILECELVKI